MNNLPLPEVEEIDDKPINQFHAQLLNGVSENALNHRNWEKQAKSVPVHQGISYDWPSNAI